MDSTSGINLAVPSTGTETFSGQYSSFYGGGFGG